MLMMRWIWFCLFSQLTATPSNNCSSRPTSTGSLCSPAIQHHHHQFTVNNPNNCSNKPISTRSLCSPAIQHHHHHFTVNTPQLQQPAYLHQDIMFSIQHHHLFTFNTPNNNCSNQPTYLHRVIVLTCDSISPSSAHCQHSKQQLQQPAHLHQVTMF